ncbi:MULTISPECIES: hypothetical protein [unclassified Burkholderia]|uniref:hypothetical protein n=2 Tax=unclassified Burkholderia TaxID=2613784 RepID=UPI0021AB8735|nr:MULTISPECIES: hypothetical protein [unclassified Burkholderia]
MQPTTAYRDLMPVKPDARQTRDQTLDAGQPHSPGRQYSRFERPRKAARDRMRNSRPDEALTMKRRALAMAVLLALGACAGAERTGTFRTMETRLLEMRQATSLQCSTPSECDRAWSRTRRYVQDHSSTRITRFSADRIETAQPYVAGEVYLWASRAESGGGGSVIRLKAMCKGMYDSNGGPGWQYDACARKILEIEQGFRSDENPPG